MGVHRTTRQRVSVGALATANSSASASVSPPPIADHVSPFGPSSLTRKGSVFGMVSFMETWCAPTCGGRLVARPILDPNVPRQGPTHRDRRQGRRRLDALPPG